MVQLQSILMAGAAVREGGHSVHTNMCTYRCGAAYPRSGSCRRERNQVAKAEPVIRRVVSPVIWSTTSSSSGGVTQASLFTSRKVRNATHEVRLLPSTQAWACHEAFREYRGLVYEIRLAVVSVPAWSVKGGEEAVTVQHVMARSRFSDLQGRRVAAHQVRRREVVDRLRGLGSRHDRKPRALSRFVGPRARLA